MDVTLFTYAHLHASCWKARALKQLRHEPAEWDLFEDMASIPVLSEPLRGVLGGNQAPRKLCLILYGAVLQNSFDDPMRKFIASKFSDAPQHLLLENPHRIGRGSGRGRCWGRRCWGWREEGDVGVVPVLASCLCRRRIRVGVVSASASCRRRVGVVSASCRRRVGFVSASRRCRVGVVSASRPKCPAPSIQCFWCCETVESIVVCVLANPCADKLASNTSRFGTEHISAKQSHILEFCTPGKRIQDAEIT